MSLIASIVVFIASLGNAATFGHSITPDDLREEIAASTSDYPWAGIYGGSGGMSPSLLYLAPSGRYCATTAWDMGPRETGYCGWLRFDDGRLTKGWWARLWGNDHYDAPPFLLIPWGERHYIVEERRILDFINAVNAADEPRVENSASAAYLRSDDGDILVLGLPDVPEKYRHLLLPRPINTTAISVSSRTTKGEGEHELKEYLSDALFDIGSSSGVFIGMKLHAQSLDHFASAVITEVGFSSSAGRIRQDDFGQQPSTPIIAGTRFSSRPSWQTNVSLSTEPLGIEIRFTSSQRYPPFINGRPNWFIFDDPFHGAAAAGFTAEEIAEVTFRGPFLGALNMKDVQARMERTVLSLGGNGYIRPDKNEQAAAEESGGVEKKRLRVFRLSFHGRPFDPGTTFLLPSVREKPGERSRYDWKRATISARASFCGLEVASRGAEQSAYFDILKWDESLLRRAHVLRFKDLNTEQLTAVSPFIPANAHTDYVWPALFHEPSAFQIQIWKRRFEAEREFTKAHPKIAEECKKLKDESWRTLH